MLVCLGLDFLPIDNVVVWRICTKNYHLTSMVLSILSMAVCPVGQSKVRLTCSPALIVITTVVQNWEFNIGLMKETSDRYK